MHPYLVNSNHVELKDIENVIEKLNSEDDIQRFIASDLLM